MSETPPPSTRARRASEEVPVKPLPRVRRVMSPPRAPPPPPPASDMPPDDTPTEEQSTDQETVEELDIEDIHLNVDNDDDSPLVKLGNVSVDNREQLQNSGDNDPDNDDDDDPDYMNVSDLHIDNEDNDNNNDKQDNVTTKRRSRPLSNYHNIAPLPEPQTGGQATINTSTTSEQDGAGGYRFKPRHRAPAIPPPGHKKLPPVDSSFLRDDTSKNNTVESVQLVPSITRNRHAVVKKTNSTPPPQEALPKPNVPVKPPRSNRQKPDQGSPSSPSTSPVFPPLSHPVVIPTSKINQLSKSGRSSPLLIKTEERSSSPNETKKEKPFMTSEVSKTFSSQKSSPALLPRKAHPPPPPPPYADITSNKTPPTHRRLNSDVNLSTESTKLSPSGGRKAVRVAPPPPKHSKSFDKDENVVKNETQILSSPKIPPKTTTTNGDIDKGPSNGSVGQKEEEIEPVKKSETLEAMKKTLDNVQTLLENTQLAKDITETQQQEGDEEEDDTESEIVLSRMNLFTVEMRKVDGQGFGLHIAEGYTQTSKGLEVKGVFVKEIVSGSPADNCGRVRESDMIIEIAGHSMLGASLEDAARILKHSGNIVRLKIGRTFSSSKEDDSGANDALFNLPLSPLQEENDKLKSEISSIKEQLEESEQNNDDLKQAIVTVTIDKTKLDMEVKSLKDKLEKEKAKAANKQPPNDAKQTEELQKKVKELTEAKICLEEKLDTVSKETKNDNSSALEESLKECKIEMTSQEDKIKGLGEEVDSLKVQLEQEKNKREEQTHLLSKRDEEIKLLKSELDKEKKEKEILTNSLSEKVIALENELANSKETVIIEVNDKPEENNIIEEVDGAGIPDVISDNLEIVSGNLSGNQEVISGNQEVVLNNQEVVSNNQDVVSNNQEVVSDNQEVVPRKEEVTAEPDVSKDSPKKKSKKQLVVKSKVSPSKKSPSRKSTPIEDTPPSDKKPVIVVEKGDKLEKLNASQEELATSREVSPFTDDDDEGDMFNELKSINRLNSSTALQKSHLSAQLRRKKPSRSHVQSFANLSPFPEDMPSLKVFSDDNRKSVGDTSIPSVAPKPRARNEDKGGPIAAPRPKPRPQPRKKQSPEHLSSPSNEIPSKTPPGSPVPAKRPIPVPRTPSHDSIEAEQKSDCIPESPKRSPILPPKPKDGPEHLPPKPRPTSEIKNNENETSEEPALVEQPHKQQPTPAKKPKPVPPKPSTLEKKPPTESTNEGLDAKIEALKRKDPSELTVKEKMILAQQAMAKQADLRSKGMPPPVRRRPQFPQRAESLDIDANEEPTRRISADETDGNLDRSHSMDDLLDEESTPKRQPRKLPPGAFNLGIPMGLPSDNRIRSYTIGSTTSDKTKSLEGSTEDDSSRNDLTTSEDQVTDDSSPMENGIPPDDNDNEDVLEETTPETTPRHKKIENEEPSDITTVSTPEISVHDGGGSIGSIEDCTDDDTVESNEALLETPTTRTSSSHLPDAEQILYWSPEVVGLWMGSVGLGQYAQVIKERGIKGYMLFDLDSARLKGMGMNSGDDRKTFAKEVKVLKPYAERLKKEHEKQKKEEKKKLEQEKKLAKKKKK